MPGRRVLTLSVLLLSCLLATAKSKKKATLPVEVLRAHTAWVIVDPQAGVDVQDPTANRQAIDAVNDALARWGRLTPVTGPSQADLIIVIRKGTGRMVQPTIAGTPMNSPPPMIGQQTDGGTSASGRLGGPPFQRQSDPHPQMEISSPDDTFAVYRGNPAYNEDPSGENPLDSPPVWRYTAKDALESPSVPAVDQFRKAIAESEKALAGP
jgi:hypothetical protein